MFNRCWTIIIHPNPIESGTSMISEEHKGCIIEQKCSNVELRKRGRKIPNNLMQADMQLSSLLFIIQMRVLRKYTSILYKTVKHNTVYWLPWVHKCRRYQMNRRCSVDVVVDQLIRESLHNHITGKQNIIWNCLVTQRSQDMLQIHYHPKSRKWILMHEWTNESIWMKHMHRWILWVKHIYFTVFLPYVFLAQLWKQWVSLQQLWLDVLMKCASKNISHEKYEE